MSAFRKLTQGLPRRYKIFTILAPLAMIGEVSMETFIPYLMSLIIDVGIENRDVAYITRRGLIMVAAAVFSLFCGAICARFASVASQGFSHNLRRRLFAKVQRFSFTNIDHFSTASLVTRLTTDVNNVQNVYQMVIRTAVRAPLMLISGVIMASVINRSLAVVFAVAIPFLLCVIVFLGARAHPLFKTMLARYDVLNRTVQENLTAIRVVKAFVRGEHEKAKFNESAAAVRDAQVKAEKHIICLMPIMQLTVYSAVIAVLWFGGKMIIVGTMRTGELASFISYVSQILMSMMMFGMIFMTLVLSRASIERMVEVLDEEVDIHNPQEAQADSIVPQSGSVTFEHVSFSYTGGASNCVLSDVSLRIPSGATAGIIGGTGSSKSTLVQLIPRLYDALDGTVRVDGRDVKEYQLETLRDSVAMVLQKNVLFSGTIRENLLWGNKNAGDEEISAACKAACADEFIANFPKGYNTELGQGGVNVSGGQKQRLCIARALLKKPKILILDDSTSAVDTATERNIRHALAEYLPGCTKIIIAQRISSVQDADIIYVLDEGRINGCGTHQELLQNNQIYREVFESQQQGSGDMDLA